MRLANTLRVEENHHVAATPRVLGASGSSSEPYLTHTSLDFKGGNAMSFEGVMLVIIALLFVIRIAQAQRQQDKD